MELVSELLLNKQIKVSWIHIKLFFDCIVLFLMFFVSRGREAELRYKPYPGILLHSLLHPHVSHDTSGERWHNNQTIIHFCVVDIFCVKVYFIDKFQALIFIPTKKNYSSHTLEEQIVLATIWSWFPCTDNLVRQYLY
jgi:hypothetical protein